MIYLGLAPVSQKGLQLHTGLAKPPHLYIQVCGGGTGTYFPGGTNSHKSRGYARIVKVFEVYSLARSRSPVIGRESDGNRCQRSRNPLISVISQNLQFLTPKMNAYLHINNTGDRAGNECARGLHTKNRSSHNNTHMLPKSTEVCVRICLCPWYCTGPGNTTAYITSRLKMTRGPTTERHLCRSSRMAPLFLFADEKTALSGPAFGCKTTCTHGDCNVLHKFQNIGHPLQNAFDLLITEYKHPMPPPIFHSTISIYTSVHSKLSTVFRHDFPCEMTERRYVAICFDTLRLWMDFEANDTPESVYVFFILRYQDFR